VGYIAYPQGELKDSLLKVQDTVPICANIFGQIVALNALKVDILARAFQCAFVSCDVNKRGLTDRSTAQAGGRDWVNANVRGLDKNRKLVHAALAPLGEDAVTPSSGAIYTVRPHDTTHSCLSAHRRTAYAYVWGQGVMNSVSRNPLLNAVLCECSGLGCQRAARMTRG
jgi:aspartate/methionine/tyrosine aminotransferase